MPSPHIARTPFPTAFRLAVCAFLVLAAGSVAAQSGFAAPQFLAGDPSVNWMEEPKGIFDLDVEGDGNMDLVVQGSNDLLLYRNDGSGNFASGESMFSTPAGSLLSATRLDWDGDGWQDVALCYALPGDPVRIGILSGNGSGFDALTPVRDGNARSMASADFDTDGDDELVMALNIPIGITAPGLMVLGLDAGPDPYVLDNSASKGYHSVFIADFDTDGLPDVLAAAANQATMNIFRFQSPAFEPALTVFDGLASGPPEQSILAYAGDWTGNGYPDVFWTDASTIRVIPNSSTGFGSPSILLSAPSSTNRFGNLRLFDMDQDGDDDLVYMQFNNSLVGWLEKTPSGVGSNSLIAEDLLWRYSNFDKTMDRALTVADVDNNGLDDLLLIGQAHHRLVHYGGVPTGGIAAPVLFDSTAWSLPFSPPELITTGDFDDDGDTDLLVQSGNAVIDFTTSYHENDGGTWRQRLVDVRQGLASGLVAADFDGDSDTDLAFEKDGIISMAKTLGAWQFDTVVLATAPGTQIQYLRGGDLEGDGDQDLAFVRTLPNLSVVLLQNDGSGTFTPSIEDGFTTPTFLRSLYFEDISGDGAAELLTTSLFTFSDLYILPNKGDGTFAPEKIVPQLVPPMGFVDPILVTGIKKAIVTTQGFNRLVGYGPIAGGSLGTPKTIWTAASSIGAFHVADFNGDGVEDIAYGSADGSVHWIELAADYQIIAHRTIDTLDYQVANMTSLDMDNDGDRELIVGTRDGNRGSLSAFNFVGGAMRSAHPAIPNDAIQGMHKGASAWPSCSQKGHTVEFPAPLLEAEFTLQAVKPATSPTMSGTVLVDAFGRKLATDQFDVQAGGIRTAALSSGSYFMVNDQGDRCRFFKP